jgi:SAM-dependent methyltransferase
MPDQPRPAAPPPRPTPPAANPAGPLHGFTDVDAQPTPTDWVAVLDRLASEPFYAAYKRRIRQLLQPHPGGRYLEVGAGTGTDAAQLAADTDATVVAVDRAHTMLSTARDRGVPHVVLADAHQLPFADHAFGGVWADRVLQHLTDPEHALDELIRVTTPAGRLVVADPDYDTQVLDLADQQLARRVLRFRADRMLRHGTLAHRHAGLLAARGLTDIQVEAPTLVVRDPHVVDNVMGLRTWAQTASQQGVLTHAQAQAWTSQLDQAVAEGRFTYAVTFFITAATTPA